MAKIFLVNSGALCRKIAKIKAKNRKINGMTGRKEPTSTELLAKIRASKLSYVVMDEDKLGSAEIETINLPVFLQRSIEAVAETIPDAGDAKRELVELQGGLTGLNRTLRKAMQGQAVEKRDIQLLEAGVGHLDGIRQDVMQFVVECKAQEADRKVEVAAMHPAKEDQEAFERDIQTSVRASTMQADELETVQGLLSAYIAALRNEQHTPHERSA